MAIVRDPLASVESGLVEIDTTRRSLIHRMSLGGTGESEPSVKSIAKTYVAAALLTYGAMAVVAALEWMLGPPRPDVKLPFWQDATTAFMFLVAFPTILVLVVTDNAALRAAMRRVQRDGVLTMTAAQEGIIEQRWSATFARLNAVIQIVALVTGAAIMIANYFAYRPETVGFWIASGGRLRPAGYVFLLSVWAFFAVIPIYVARTFAVSFLLANVVRAGDIRMLPFHPDKCGGLRPVGSLALRNQYGLSVMGINVVLFALMSTLYLDTPHSLSVLIALAVVAYLVVGPIVFMGPLLPFRAGMMRTKSELMSEVAQRLRIELSRIRAELQSGVITREDEELIDRLRKIGAVIDELPVWPFDAGILRRFLTAYVVPLIGAMVYPFASIVFDKVVDRLR